MGTHTGPIRVMALHALAYCEKLFYREEVEEIRVADDRVYDGRTPHAALDEEGALVGMNLEAVDALLILRLCPSCAEQACASHVEAQWPTDTNPFEIVG